MNKTSSTLYPDITLNSARESSSAYFSKLKKPTNVHKLSLAELPRTTKNESFMEKYFQKKNGNAPKKVQSYVNYNSQKQMSSISSQHSQKQISNVSCLWRRHPQILSKKVP